MHHIQLTLSDQRDALLLDHETPNGISPKIPPITIKKNFGAEDIAISIVISFAAGIPASIVAAWLYDKLKHGRSRQISINHREIYLDKGQITKIIEDSINIKDK